MAVCAGILGRFNVSTKPVFKSCCVDEIDLVHFPRGAYGLLGTLVQPGRLAISAIVSDGICGLQNPTAVT